MDLSEKPELGHLARALEPMARHADDLGIPWILIGAQGRDLLLEHVHGLTAGRRTEDVDVAIEVETWGEWSDLRGLLIEKDGALEDSARRQRLEFPSGVSIDLVPFGGIEKDAEIRWPPGSNPVLSVYGFREAYDHSTAFTLPGPLEIRAPTVEAYVCLKLFAWRDRHVEKPNHDSADLRTILQHAGRLIPLERLYDKHASAMESNGFDPTLGVLHVLGQRLGETLLPKTRDELTRILQAETNEDGRLDLVRELGPAPRKLSELRALLEGLSSPR